MFNENINENNYSYPVSEDLIDNDFETLKKETKEKKDNEKDFSQTEMEIRHIFQMMCQFGAVDSEKDLIENIIQDMKSGKISEAKAVETATKILHDKNGYLTQYR